MVITACPSRLGCNFQSLTTYIHAFISVWGISMCNVHMCTYVYRYVHVCLWKPGQWVSSGITSYTISLVCVGRKLGVCVCCSSTQKENTGLGGVHSLFPPCEPLPVSRHVCPLCYKAGQSAPLQDPGHHVLPHHGLKTMVPGEHRLLKLSQNKSFLL